MPPVLHGEAEAGRHRRSRRSLQPPLRHPRRQVLNPEQRKALLAAKLRAVLAGSWQTDASALTPASFAAGAGLVDPARSTGWVLVDVRHVERDPLDTDPIDAMPRGWMGGAVAWGERHGVAQLHVIADDVDGSDARRLSWFSRPPSLWRVVGTAVVAVGPVPFVDAPFPDAVSELFREVIEGSGAEVVVEMGVIRGEVLGLEVARVVRGEDGAPSLEIGVGRHDRLAQSMLRGADQAVGALDEAVAAVRERRTWSAGTHPAHQLAPERWLRTVLVREPALVGAAVLSPVAGTREPVLKRSGPACAIGTRADGSAVVVAASVGVDLDVFADAADVRAARASNDTPLVIVLPEGDDLPVMRLLATRLAHPATIVTVTRDWRALS